MPSGFIPEIDQGVIFVNVELPEGASLERTEKVMNQVEDILKSTPGIAHTINRIGSSIVTQATAPNSGTVICIFEPFEDRKKDEKQSLRAVLSEIEGRFSEISEARVIAFPLPSVRGLSTTGGVKLMVQDRGGGTPENLEKALQGPIQQAGPVRNWMRCSRYSAPALRRFMPTSIASKPRAGAWMSARFPKPFNSI